MSLTYVALHCVDLLGCRWTRTRPSGRISKVAAQSREQIASGAIGPRLPSAMVLADQMGVAPNTVQRALRVLRDEGLIHSVPGRGTFVNKQD